MHASTFLPATLAVYILLANRPALASAAEIEEPAAKLEPRGLRANVGLFVLGHAKRPSDASASSFAFVPGLALGGGYRLGSWELEVAARAAYFSRREVHDGGLLPYEAREHTLFAGLGGGARWFTSRTASQAAFLSAGVDVLVLDTGDFFGAGPAARAGIGVELWHDNAHHRLALEASLLVPTFRLESQRGSTLSATTSTAAPLVYMVPLTTTARWTF